jgi:hypothetical protein
MSFDWEESKALLALKTSFSWSGAETLSHDTINAETSDSNPCVMRTSKSEKNYHTGENHNLKTQIYFLTSLLLYLGLSYSNGRPSGCSGRIVEHPRKSQTHTNNTMLHTYNSAENHYPKTLLFLISLCLCTSIHCKKLA